MLARKADAENTPDLIPLYEWCVLQIFRNTVSDEDESSKHVLYTFESKHPYRPMLELREKIFVPGSHTLSNFFNHYPVSFIVMKF
jgi:hypothetical protein